MRQVLVYDASVLIAYLKGERGAEVVVSLLKDTNNMHFVHGVNMGEVYYKVREESDDKTAQSTVGKLVTDGISIRNDFDDRLWKDAASWKAQLIPKRSFADCFCLAFALRISGEIVTCDHPDFDDIANHSICPVRFIR
jgi:predicted nucleic acid-binding protein